MKEYIPLDTLSEYVDLLVLAVYIIHITLPTSYFFSKPVVFGGGVILSWIHDRKLMV